MNGRKLLFIFLLTGAILMGWLAGWGFRKEITIQDTNISANLTDFPVYVPINADADFHESLATGYDIRFTQSDGETLLKFSRVYWTGGNGSPATADFFVKVPSILATGGATIYIYYGKAGAPDGEDATNTWNSGYKAVYHLNEASGTIYDDTGNNHDSVAENVMAYQQAGKMRYAIDFEPSDGGAPHYISIPHHADFNVGTGEISVELWCKAEAFSYWDVAASKRGANGWRFYEYDTDKLRTYMINGGNNTYESAELDAGNWHFWVMTRDPSTYHHGYKDGVEIGTQTAFNYSLDSTDVMVIGNQSAVSANGFDGLIEGFRFSDVERDSNWLLFQFKNVNEGDNELTWAAEEAAGGITLVVADGTHGHSTDSILLSQLHNLIVQAADHGHLADSPVLTQAHVLAIAEALHNHLAESPVLTQAHVLAIAEALHAHSSDPIALFQAHQIAIDDALHGHLADLITLSQIHQLIVNDADHNHLADNIVLLTGYLLVVNDALHSHSADNITLSQVHNLLVNAGLHALASDSIILSQVHSLAVNGGLHDHLVDNIDIIIEGIKYATMGPHPTVEEDVIFIGTKEPTFIGKEGIIFISEDEN